MALKEINVPPPEHVRVLDGQGWIGLLNCMGTETTIVNAARVSFGKMREEMDERDVVLLKYMLENQHTSPLEHVGFTFIVHCPLFVRGQWHRHRTWSYNEISRRYTEINLEFYTPPTLREQAETNRQASVDPVSVDQNTGLADIREHNERSLALYHKLLADGVCREQARGVLPQNMMTTFWATVDLHNLIGFLALRDSEHAQWEIQQYARAIKQLVAPHFPTLKEILEWDD
ncbi:MAG: FAD-dependent thymidylate synthase [Lentisphaeria bacterium]|nr:FAD-dependent thymidylate synthase [Lentisphaeria bacterium]